MKNQRHSPAAVLQNDGDNTPATNAPGSASTPPPGSGTPGEGNTPPTGATSSESSAGTPGAESTSAPTPTRPPAPPTHDRMERKTRVWVRNVGTAPIAHRGGVATAGERFQVDAADAGALGSLVRRED